MGRYRRTLDIEKLKRRTDGRWNGRENGQKTKTNPPTPETLKRLFLAITLTERGATWPVDWGRRREWSGLRAPRRDTYWFQTADGELRRRD